MVAAKPLPVTEYQKFRHKLFGESPRAAYWLEAMVYGIMAQVDGMTEDTALELACKIVALPGRAGPRQSDAKRKTRKAQPETEERSHASRSIN